jgi:hypothetical protein
VNVTDDPCILGIQGTLSGLALRVLTSRLFQGQEPKAQRGERYKRVAPGSLCADGTSLVKAPKVRVQEASALVLRKLRARWSVRQVFQWCHAEGMARPVHKSVPGTAPLVWQRPT